MSNRKKIGLIYEYNENWIGGTYYIQNLVAALKCIEGFAIPEIYIYTEEDEHFEQLKAVTQYPLLYRGGQPILEKVFGKRSAGIIRSKLLARKPLLYLKNKMDVIFPAQYEWQFHPRQQFIYWIPDFQEHYLPEFFTKKEVDSRKAYQQSLLKKAKYLIFSSLATQQDFNVIYPGSAVRQFVLPFAVTHPSLDNHTNNTEKYEIEHPYFICCNQFWEHKNHIKALEAIKIIKEKGKEVYVVFTGKDYDSRNPNYFTDIKKTVKLFGIEKNISFLGFIDRADQLSLIKKSIAVIQPSLFEGWSTVIEDAKSLGVNIIASDLQVHREQLAGFSSARFFNPYNANELVEKMILQGESPITETAIDYESSIKKFGTSFMHIVHELI